MLWYTLHKTIQTQKKFLTISMACCLQPSIVTLTAYKTALNGTLLITKGCGHGRGYN